MKRSLFLITSLFCTHTFAQISSLKGRLRDARTGEAIGFQEIIFIKNRDKIGVKTDYEGKFSTESIADSLSIERCGYENLRKKLDSGITYLNLDLKPIKEIINSEKTIKEVNVRAKKKYKNPAWEILEKLVARKPQNDPERLESLQSRKYSRIEIGMQDLGKKFEKLKVLEDIRQVVGENQKTVPIFVSENLSRVYSQKGKVSETIEKTNVQGIGIEDGSVFSQLMSSTFVKYNFYRDYVRILEKDFYSPLHNNFKLLYNFELVNRDVQIDGKGYYEIHFTPKRDADLAFSGKLWIGHSNYDLYRIEAKVSSGANLNFIHSMHIQQEMEEFTDTEICLPKKSSVIIETSKISDSTPSVVLKYFTYETDYQLNKVIPSEIFNKPFQMLSDANHQADWEKIRPEVLSDVEIKAFDQIQQIKKLPRITAYVDIIDMIAGGYYKLGKLGIGPVPMLMAYNDVEGFRTRLGFRTNTSFSEKWNLEGFAAYGTRDARLKYGISADYIFSKEPWIQGGVRIKNDIGQIALQNENFSLRTDRLFQASTYWGKLSHRRAFLQDIVQAYLRADLTPSLAAEIRGRFNRMIPYYGVDALQGKETELRNFDLVTELRWQDSRMPISSINNRQIAVKLNPWSPTLTLRYTQAFKNFFDSELDHSRLSFNIQGGLPWGIWGKTDYMVTASRIFGQVPLPYLENHLGNNYVFYNKNAFNMMNFFEFSSSEFTSLSITHHFEGLLTNSIPVIRKWNWRNHLTAQFLWGNIRPEVYPIHQQYADRVSSLGGKPYIEIGYGISNIFRALRVDFIHRLSHLDHYDAVKGKLPGKFGVKFSVMIRL